MKIAEKIKQIEQLETIESPWVFNRIFGKPSLFGSQIAVGNDGDFVSLAEAQEAVAWFVEQLGGSVTWSDKTSKKQSKQNKQSKQKKAKA